MIAELSIVRMSLEVVSQNAKTFFHTKMQTLSHKAEPFSPSRYFVSFQERVRLTYSQDRFALDL